MAPPGPGQYGPPPPGGFRPVGPAGPAYPPFPPPPGGKKKSKAGRVVAVIVVVVLLIGAAAGVWFWRMGDDSVSQDDLPQNPNLAAMAFPDPDKFDFGGGPDAMCAAVDKVMSPRGYQRVTAGKSNGGIYCRFVTPAVSLLKDGSNNVNVDVANWRDDAETRYEGLLQQTVKQNARRSGNRAGKVENFPVGDAGFIYYRDSDGRSDTEAYFRSGDDLMLVSLWGSISHVSESGETERSEPLGEKTSYGEIADIVTALNGGGTPGEPRISKPDMKEHTALAGLTAPRLPTGGTPDEKCGTLAAVTRELGTKKKQFGGKEQSWSCSFEPAAASSGLPEGAVQRKITVGIEVHPKERNIRASQELGRDLPRLLRQTAEHKGSPLYSLPIGASGYAIYHGGGHGFLYAGYLADDETYVHIEISGYRKAGNSNEALTEDVMIADLLTLLKGMGG